MRRTLLWILGAGLLMLGTTRPSRAQLVVAAGLNFDDITDIEVLDREATFENATGWHLGVLYDIALGPVALRPGVIYRDMSNVEFDLAGMPERFGFDVSMIDVPIDVRFRLAATPLVKPYATVGPVFSFVSNVDEEFEDAVEDFRLSADVGVGLELAIPGLGLRLYPELRYAFGVSKFINDEFTLLGQQVRAEESARLNSFMLRLGVGL
ncbi:MAG: hypothetical protein KatS3mg043_0762 [Rhodothermaceae bacterium]|nr:MAG: hypothetical protein KatS3mg043_0762 [Rhodothermaceae bacterium]